ncbi:nuclear transport factor 2 family protein [Nitrosopumilus sp.]|uniref:nuclear transport factor 2 family protein n=1 Tax=Nitrosopumilus sp. TaxID=2024843 RepID=UPI002624580C|nr:nuclear transport factor 2 family protein [Nitrosopumilus sp.]
MTGMLETWVEKIRTNDPNQVAELYHPEDGLLLGTFSDIERPGHDLILKYFENLLKSQVDVEIVTQHKHETDSLVANSGLYNFIVDGKTVKARYTFVFIKTGDAWKILSHHSSVLPEGN